MSDKKKKTSAQDAQGQGETAGAGGEAQAAQASTNEPPEWFAKWQAEQQKQLDARFEGISKATKQQRDAIKKLIDPEHEPDEETSDKRKAAKGLTDEDLKAERKAARQLERVRASLPEDLREQVDQAEDERGIQDALWLAERLAKSAPSKEGGKTARAGARGVGASPPQDQQVPVSSKEELRELAKQAATDPEARKRMLEIVKTPGFSRKALI